MLERLAKIMFGVSIAFLVVGLLWIFMN
ncbi:conserved hypothetical protein [Exiguobacterium oxidotolerans]|uniref:Uncharacterized protein n=1 Tax=Exiguobacterium oxidotolerans TaxID=223958 RepID=A0A653I7U1_9BACL|nr:conserved hypothetical protein [Exiguobacterium oxidotolerans]